MHQLWHVVVLVAALLAAAAIAIAAVAPLAFDRPPQGLLRARPFAVAVAVSGVAVVLVEWLLVH